MSATLLQQMTSDRRQTRTAALERYRSILRRNGKPQSGDSEALADAMEVLDVDHDDLAADVAALDRETALNRKLATPAALEKLAADATEADESLLRHHRAFVVKLVEVLPIDALNYIVGSASGGKGLLPDDELPAFTAGADQLRKIATDARCAAETCRIVNSNANAELEQLRAKHPRVMVS